MFSDGYRNGVKRNQTERNEILQFAKWGGTKLFEHGEQASLHPIRPELALLQ